MSKREAFPLLNRLGANIRADVAIGSNPTLVMSFDDWMALDAEISRAMQCAKALKPFAEAAKQFERGPGGHLPTDRVGHGQKLTAAMLWAAADVLARATS